MNSSTALANGGLCKLRHNNNIDPPNCFRTKFERLNVRKTQASPEVARRVQVALGRRCITFGTKTCCLTELPYSSTFWCGIFYWVTWCCSPASLKFEDLSVSWVGYHHRWRCGDSSKGVPILFGGFLDQFFVNIIYWNSEKSF